MSTKVKLQDALTDFNIALSQLEGIARDERSRVEAAFHVLLTAVGQLSNPEPAAEIAETADEPEAPKRSKAKAS